MATNPQQLQQVNAVENFMKKAGGRIEAVIPRTTGLTLAKVHRTAMIAVSGDRNLLACKPESIVRSVILAAELGLEVGGALGSAYLVPYKQNATLIVGYKGLIDLARRSGDVMSVEAHVVYEGDEFDYAFGTESFLTHRPRIGRASGAKCLGAYCVVKYKSGGTQFDFMTEDEILKVKGSSKASASGPWKTHADEMRKKTAIRRTLKLVPMSKELASALTIENEADAGTLQGAAIIDVLPEDIADPPTTADAVRDKLQTLEGGKSGDIEGSVEDGQPKEETQESLPDGKGEPGADG